MQAALVEKVGFKEKALDFVGCLGNCRKNHMYGMGSWFGWKKETHVL